MYFYRFLFKHHFYWGLVNLPNAFTSFGVAFKVLAMKIVLNELFSGFFANWSLFDVISLRFHLFQQSLSLINASANENDVCVLAKVPNVLKPLDI